MSEIENAIDEEMTSKIDTGSAEADEAVELNETDRLFDALCQQFYHAWFRFHPEIAVDLGVYDYADQLTSYEHDDIGALLVLNQKMLSALDEINCAELSAVRQSDFRIVKGAITVELHDLEDNDWRYRNPLDYVPVNAIYQLLIHPGKNVQDAIEKRLQLIPDYLRGARVMLSQYPDRVVPQWAHTAREMSVSGTAFIRGLARHPLIAAKFSSPARLQPLLDDAAVALNEFALNLERDVIPKAKGKFASGHNRFNRLLKMRHFLDTDAEAVLKFGERLVQDTEQELLQQSALICGEQDIAEALAKVRQKHPEASQLIDTYRRQMQAAHAWLLQADIVSVPERQSLKVQQTPLFMRDVIPFAAYEPPMPEDKEQRGLYYVTTVEDESLLAEHNQYSIDLTSVHEAFPGHHLQFVIANQNNRNNMTRLLNTSASMYEGWALYCEQLVFEQGLYDKEEHKFIMLRDRLWRALRIIIDVKIHTGQFSLEEAADLLVDKLGFDPSQAASEVNWYCHSAATPLCYAVGSELILKARDIVGVADNAELKAFHDDLLSQGSIALPLVIQSVFGDAVWQAAHDEMFAG